MWRNFALIHGKLKKETVLKYKTGDFAKFRKSSFSSFHQFFVKNEIVLSLLMTPASCA